jgi:hypothetical protein
MGEQTPKEAATLHDHNMVTTASEVKESGGRA